MLKLKRILCLLMCFLFMLPILNKPLASQADVFDLSDAELGIVKVNQALKDKKIKVMIQKNNVSYFYDVNNVGQTLPLQMGSGTYKLTLLEYIDSNKYLPKDSKDIEVKLADEKLPFLQSASPIYWDKNGEAAKMAAKLSENLSTDEQKAYAIYDYIVKNFEYDKDKVKSLNSNYIPSVEETLSTKKGICFDYAALYAAMLRSINIPAKLVKGYKNDVSEYHAWNEVYLQNQGWITVDACYDSIMSKSGKAVSFKKNANEFKKEKEY
ncbi:transglutaminase-like domain-containing protein [Tepidanaerobacter syntrophicus]|uniref:transglutaminase-like domain-containing protein n=1 Tax=Tepidanaerobacter syntrophicus TaxID=224999 RepID=UPI001BD5B203|nr:transglutaminase-like domain-containing protein [Tepidanaerobacter syntrophicus]